jgi:hypothetical protein
MGLSWDPSYLRHKEIDSQTSQIGRILECESIKRMNTGQMRTFDIVLGQECIATSNSALTTPICYAQHNALSHHRRSKRIFDKMWNIKLGWDGKETDRGKFFFDNKGNYIKEKELSKETF